MPTKPKRPRSTPRRSPPSGLADAHAEVLARFDRVVTGSLGPLLGKAGLAAVRRDLAIVTSVGGGVVAHAGVRKGVMTLERIAKEKPIVGVLVNTIPLVDKASLTSLEPGAYVVRLRSLGEGAMAFDFFSEKSRPAYSTTAEPTHATPADRKAPVYHGLADVELDFPWDPDGLEPPTNGTSGKFCLSLLIWKHCWDWDWPDIDWDW